MNDLFDTLQKMIRQEMRGRRFAEMGTVQAVYPTDPGNYDADVVVHAAELVLRHVPVLTPRLASYWVHLVHPGLKKPVVMR